ncbi:MAG: GNVR domain-containing protein [Pseudomonadota bacterium]
MPQYDVDLRDYWRILKKRKAIIAMMVVLVGVSSFGFAKLKEPVPQYETTAAVKIDRETNLAAILTGSFFMQSESLTTHAYIITSYPVIFETAKMLGYIPKNRSFEDVRKEANFMRVLQRIKGMVAAENEPGTNIINISVTSSNPKETSEIANAIAAAYQEYNIKEKNRKTYETKSFIEDQLGKTHKNLKTAEETLQNFKENSSLVSIDAQTQNTLSQLFDIERKLAETQQTKRNIHNIVQLIEKKGSQDLSAIEQYLADPNIYSPIYALNKTLSELLITKETLLIDFTPEHPKVKEIGHEISTIVSELNQELISYLKELKAKEADLETQRDELRRQSMMFPEKALQLVRLQRAVTVEETLFSQLQIKYQETLIHESGRVQEVSVVKPAIIPQVPFNIPSKTMIVLTGLVMGLIIGVVLAFGVEVFDTSMGTIEDVEALLGIPVLGVIPFMAKDEKDKRKKQRVLKGRQQDLVAHYDPKSLPAEAFRALRSNIEFIRVDKKLKTFLITSSFVQEGKTFNAVNLALSMGQAGHKVLLIEADLRKPVIHKMFGVTRIPGLTDFILGNYALDDITKNIADVMLGDFEVEDVLHTPGLDNLTIITSGTTPPNPAEILRSERFKDFLKTISLKFDIVLIDSPPVLPVADATEISGLVDGVLLVYTVGKIGRSILKRAKVSLDNVDANVMGVVLNNVKPEAGPDYFKYHTQYYYGRSSAEEA